MADDAPSAFLSRRHQMFPVLSEADLAQMHRFGTQQAHPRGARLVTAGEPSPGMFVVLKGVLAVSQRDGMGRVTPIVQHGRGHFMGEVGTLSGKPSLVDGIAHDTLTP
ncbi:MAG: cyclic nucleotide-binding domain-containing protein [Burkholderiales bacterium]|nr:cyclic nucleotide-binding domain-containing protein [Burkholderiales bacterium]